ncbi:hypothetical protein EVG20_g4889 [Dentipellis fragilis]|uniref:Uncharacterized protein n=1 Tax=Dentipellis fragilis TaxID=205917 RepID=A0A4Y9YXA3_9AGAM|nr:hypothetical protein EVG20_g4889 [Dentipellis fragilis]
MREHAICRQFFGTRSARIASVLCSRRSANARHWHFSVISVWADEELEGISTARFRSVSAVTALRSSTLARHLYHRSNMKFIFAPLIVAAITSMATLASPTQVALPGDNHVELSESYSAPGAADAFAQPSLPVAMQSVGAWKAFEGYYNQLADYLSAVEAKCDKDGKDDGDDDRTDDDPQGQPVRLHASSTRNRLTLTLDFFCVCRAQVQLITMHNTGAYTSYVRIVYRGITSDRLGPSFPTRKSHTLDLSQFQLLKEGETFQVKVDIVSGKDVTAGTVLTYGTDNKNSNANFHSGGGTQNAWVAFDGYSG